MKPGAARRWIESLICFFVPYASRSNPKIRGVVDPGQSLSTSRLISFQRLTAIQDFKKGYHGRERDEKLRPAGWEWQ